MAFTSRMNIREADSKEGLQQGLSGRKRGSSRELEKRTQCFTTGPCEARQTGGWSETKYRHRRAPCPGIKSPLPVTVKQKPRKPDLFLFHMKVNVRHGAGFYF